MTDSRNGVTAQMKSEENCAVLNHCYGHAQNLALSDTVKKTKICRDGIDIGYKVSKLIRFSPKRKATLEWIKLENIDQDYASHGIAHFAQLDGQ